MNKIITFNDLKEETKKEIWDMVYKEVWDFNKSRFANDTQDYQELELDTAVETDKICEKKWIEWVINYTDL